MTCASSVADYARRAAGAALSATLSHFPNAKVEVLVFDRRVHHRYGRFVEVAQARADLDQLVVPAGNGSAIDDALEAADHLLAGAPPGAARRIIAVTDGLARSSLTPARVQAAVATSGAIVHVGIFREGWPRLSRFDQHDWSAPVRSTGGLVWEALGSDEAKPAAAQVAVYEEWARPRQL